VVEDSTWFINWQPMWPRRGTGQAGAATLSLSTPSENRSLFAMVKKVRGSNHGIATASLSTVAEVEVFAIFN
jgi:hypothetical protein